MRVAWLAGLLAAAVFTAGFVLLATGLRPVGHGDVVAARAATWLRGYRYVTSTLRIGRRVLHGRCFHGWFGGPTVRDEHGTILALENGASVRVLAHRLAASRLPAALRPLDALELAGCTAVLGERLDSLAATAAVHVQREVAAGTTVLALRFRHLTVTVAPVSDRPLGVELDGARSSIRMVRLTPALERALEALR